MGIAYLVYLACTPLRQLQKVNKPTHLKLPSSLVQTEVRIAIPHVVVSKPDAKTFTTPVPGRREYFWIRVFNPKQLISGFPPHLWLLQVVSAVASRACRNLSHFTIVHTRGCQRNEFSTFYLRQMCLCCFENTHSLIFQDYDCAYWWVIRGRDLCPGQRCEVWHL